MANDDDKPQDNTTFGFLPHFFLIFFEFALSLVIIGALGFCVATVISFDYKRRRFVRPLWPTVMACTSPLFLFHMLATGAFAVGAVGMSEDWPLWMDLLVSLTTLVTGITAIVLVLGLGYGAWLLVKGKLDRLFAHSDAEREEARKQAEYDALNAGEEIEMDEGSNMNKRTDDEEAAMGLIDDEDDEEEGSSSRTSKTASKKYKDEDLL